MRFGRDHIKSLLEPLLSGLFKLFSEDSGENPYLMWAISKVLSVSKQDAAPFLNQSVRLICTKLEQIYQHPNDGQFGHYLFESVPQFSPSFTNLSPVISLSPASHFHSSLHASMQM